MHPSCTGDLSQPQRGGYNEIKILFFSRSQDIKTLPHTTDLLGLLGAFTALGSGHKLKIVN